jgi:hypothetical protein
MHVNKEKSKEQSMARKITRATLLGLVGTLLVTSLVAAQQPGMSGHMSMEAMMRECQAHCQETTASIDHMMTTMSQAQQSNDPTQMREALEQAQKPLATMKDHIVQCMNKMSMMQQMQGGMGSHMQQKK